MIEHLHHEYKFLDNVLNFYISNLLFKFLYKHILYQLIF